VSDEGLVLAIDRQKEAIPLPARPCLKPNVRPRHFLARTGLAENHPQRSIKRAGQRPAAANFVGPEEDDRVIDLTARMQIIASEPLLAPLETWCAPCRLPLQDCGTRRATRRRNAIGWRNGSDWWKDWARFCSEGE
jgi:hypothetical protein